MKKLILSICIIMGISSQAQNVNFVDNVFKNRLLQTSAINTNGDTEIQISEAVAYTGIIYTFNLNVTDLTGLEEFVNITGLQAYNNDFTSLDVSNNTQLQQILIENNSSLTGNVDLSMLPNLTDFKAHSTNISNINVANGNNQNFTRFETYSNSTLNCIQIDSGFIPNLSWNRPSTATYDSSCYCNDIIYIPDTNFKTILLANSAINTNNDSEIQCTEASAFTGQINVTNSNIADLTGIEAFTYITGLYCGFNQLTTLDLTFNSNINSLYCNDNQLTEIIFAPNILLDYLRCHNNHLTSIDPPITLVELNCSDNFITDLDVSNCGGLELLYCDINFLTSLNVANGNNMAITGFDATDNPALTCIKVDDVTYSNANWTAKPAGANYSVSCTQPCIVNIPDVNFKNCLLNNPLINLNGDTEIQCSEANQAQTISCINEGINNVTGLDSFENITNLNLSNNNLTSLDISNNTSLTILTCNYNQLTSLNLGNNPSLSSINCDFNNLSTLDLSTSVNLDALYCKYNDLTSLDITQNTALNELECSHNELSQLNTDENTTMTYLYCNNNNLVNLDFTENSFIRIIYCHSNTLTDLDLSSNADLEELLCDSNSLTSLNVANGFNVMNLQAVYANANPNLECIKHDIGFNPTQNTSWIKDSTASWSTDCSYIISNITVQGENGITEINTNGGTLQMEAIIQPLLAQNNSITWSVANSTGSATISSTGLLTAQSNGIVTVIATANDGSGISDSEVIEIKNQTVGINDINFENLAIYPNPTNGIINLDISEELYSIKIMGLTGKTIKVFDAEQTLLDISTFSSGIYFLEIANAERKSVVKIVKQ